MKTFLRKIGVGILMFTLVMSVASAYTNLENATPEELRKFCEMGVTGACPGSNPIGTRQNHVVPGFGGCNKDATWCWNIDINPPFNKHNPQPIELYGSRAKKLIAQGEIFQAELSPYGVFYLGVHSYRYRREFNCTVNVTRRSYHCITSQ